MRRRDFTRSLSLAAIGASASSINILDAKASDEKPTQAGRRNLKITLNAYSFDRLLRKGAMTISDMIDFCSMEGFDGVDLTGYYFPGYPAVPPDDYIYSVKRRAYRSGLDITGTGVRNDFGLADPGKRDDEKKLVKAWIDVAEKLGAPQIRIFSGNRVNDKIPRADRERWIAGDILECAEYGKKHGVMIALQNHNDFLTTATEIESLMKLLNSEWIGLMLDIGSYHTPDPYADIERNSGFATSWQLKEKVFINDKQVDTDYVKILGIIRKCGYTGYLPIETLGEGDPYYKIAALFKKVVSLIRG